MFKGTTKAVFVDRREYTGPLWEQIDEAFQFVLRNIHLGAAIVGIYRQDIYEIPPEAIRELIINAMVHRSYLDHGTIQVAVQSVSYLRYSPVSRILKQSLSG